MSGFDTEREERIATAQQVIDKKDLAALEAEFREKAVRIAQRILRIHREPASCHNSETDARAVLALHAEIEKRKERE